MLPSHDSHPLIRQHWHWLGLAALMLMAWLAYAPGLSGGFLFDDFVNLDALGNRGPIVDGAAFLRYVTSGVADPTGRPIALLSFLLDARDWPADPAPFLRTNLLLHLLNGALLFALLRRLGRSLDGADRRNEGTALLGAGLWLLHPLLVSTTLYIVQREAMLPATFALLGLLAYAHGRQVYARDASSSGLWWMAGGILLGTLLATLCKANGVLLPLLAWVLEACIFSRGDVPGPDQPMRTLRLNRLRHLLLILPSLVVLAYVARFVLIISQDIGRSWTIGQRLLTEPRVLIDYLQLLVAPRSISTGLYNDDYPVSVSLWQPITTLPAIVLLIGLIVLGFRLRKRAPALAAALLFFFAGHLLESSSVPLEIYFEHRNYLPALLLFWPIARGLVNLKISTTMRCGLAAGLLALCAVTTWQRASLWGQPELLSTLLARQNPDSSRAQASAAISQIIAGHPEQAVLRLNPLWRQRPRDLQIALNYVSATCAWRGLSAGDAEAISASFRHADKGALLVRKWMNQAIEIAASQQCPGLDLAVVKSWLSAAAENPNISDPRGYRASMASLYGQIAIREQLPDQALAYLNEALAGKVSPEIAGGQAALLASNGYYAQALKHLDFYESVKGQVGRPGVGMPRLHAIVLARQGYWPRELALLRAKLEAEIAAGSSPPKPVPKETLLAPTPRSGTAN